MREFDSRAVNASYRENVNTLPGRCQAVGLTANRARLSVQLPNRAGHSVQSPKLEILELAGAAGGVFAAVRSTVGAATAADSRGSEGDRR
jgi:hypothetical protein